MTSTSTLHAFVRDLYVKSTRRFTYRYVKFTRARYANFTRTLRSRSTPTLREVYAGAKTFFFCFAPTLHQLYITFTPTLRQRYVNCTCPIRQLSVGTVKLEAIDRGGLGFQPASIALLE